MRDTGESINKNNISFRKRLCCVLFLSIFCTNTSVQATKIKSENLTSLKREAVLKELETSKKTFGIPIFISSTPISGATGVLRSANIVLTFSEAIAI
ncbi:MAG: hypothetical protein JKY02_06980, partial [Flavobacteriaceae bacterium]|nr:hypothetical protein [Flavobacteriaceae bacterium]